MEITVNIGGDIKEYIDIEDLQKQIASDLQNQIRYAISGMINKDYDLKQIIQRMLAEKIANAVLPQELQDAVASKILETVNTADSTTVQYIWGLYEKGRAILESKHDDIENVVKHKIDAATELLNFSEWDIKSTLSQVVINAIKEKKMDWKVDEIVSEFIEQHLSDFLNEAENNNIN